MLVMLGFFPELCQTITVSGNHNIAEILRREEERAWGGGRGGRGEGDSEGSLNHVDKHALATAHNKPQPQSLQIPTIIYRWLSDTDSDTVFSVQRAKKINFKRHLEFISKDCSVCQVHAFRFALGANKF